MVVIYTVYYIHCVSKQCELLVLLNVLNVYTFGLKILKQTDQKIIEGIRMYQNVHILKMY